MCQVFCEVLIALKLAHEEISAGFVANDRLRQERGWKLFIVLPRMLLHRPPRGCLSGERQDVGSFPEVVGGAVGRLLSRKLFRGRHAM